MLASAIAFTGQFIKLTDRYKLAAFVPSFVILHTERESSRKFCAASRLKSCTLHGRPASSAIKARHFQSSLPSYLPLILEMSPSVRPLLPT